MSYSLSLTRVEGSTSEGQSSGFAAISLIEIVLDPARAGSHDYKVAAIQKTIAFPIDPWFQLGDPRVVLALLLVAVGLILDRVVDGGAADPS